MRSRRVGAALGDHAGPSGEEKRRDFQQAMTDLMELSYEMDA